MVHLSAIRYIKCSIERAFEVQSYCIMTMNSPALCNVYQYCAVQYCIQEETTDPLGLQAYSTLL